MKKASSNEIQRGQAISFRVPSDTPDHLLKHIQKLKESERRNFSSKIAEFVMQGVSRTVSRERETITIPLPQKLSKAQRDWLKHEHSEALLGNIVFQLLSNPVRSTSLLASLNSNSLDIDEALYLQEEEFPVFSLEKEEPDENEQPISTDFISDIEDEDEDDLNSFDWETAKQKKPLIVEEETHAHDDVEDLLGGFLANMNK